MRIPVEKVGFVLSIKNKPLILLDASVNATPSLFEGSIESLLGGEEVPIPTLPDGSMRIYSVKPEKLSAETANRSEFPVVQFIEGLNVESAGFVYVNYDPIDRKFNCSPFGESISLGIKSSPDMDKLKLDRMLNGAY